MKTLSYDCGNPGYNMSAGGCPQCFFYLLDRHASLAMTKGTKRLIPQSLTTPAASRHPSNGGELSMFPSRSKLPFTTDGTATPVLSRNKVPLCGGVARSAGVVYHPKLRRRVVYHELRVTSNSTAVIAKEYDQR